MPEELNLSNHDRFFEARLSYNFTTSSGKQYSAFFTATNYFENSLNTNEHIVSFGFSLNERGTKAFILDDNCSLKRVARVDSMVRNTIFAIINQFLSNYPSKAIVFICDNKDSRERCRQKLFSDWYQQSVRFRLTAIRKYDLDLHGVETFYGHVSLILRDDHVLHDQIKEVFLTLSDNLISKNY